MADSDSTLSDNSDILDIDSENEAAEIKGMDTYNINTNNSTRNNRADDNSFLRMFDRSSRSMVTTMCPKKNAPMFQQITTTWEHFFWDTL